MRDGRWQLGVENESSHILPSPPTPLPSLGEGSRSRRRGRGEGKVKNLFILITRYS
jgi:hypothetical protein